MEIIQKLKHSAKRGFTMLCATVMMLTSGILTGTEWTASAATLHGTTYLNEALNRASGGKYREPLETWQNFLDEQSQTNYYLGTPYSSWLYAASPRGDLWQRNEGYSNRIGANGGTNCTGFVWHIIANGLAQGSGRSIQETSPWVPNAKNFNSKGFSRNCWANGGWYTFITQYNVHYYEFATKAEMLNSGVLQKGDIIWCVNASYGSGLNGLSKPASDHHIGIYMGDGRSDRWWQSGPIHGDGNTTGEINSINQIYGKATNNTYVVVPWAENYTPPTFDPTRIRIQKQDTETGTASAQGGASLEGAEFTFKYYAGTSATGTPARTWVLRTDEDGFATLNSPYLVSGSPYVDSVGKYYLPLGTVTVQETKAPAGYKINHKITTLYIEDHDKSGRATIRVDGTTSYLQEYTVGTDEEVIRGDFHFEKVDESDNPLIGVPFLLTNIDTGESHLIFTDRNGLFDSAIGREKTNLLDEYKSNITTNGDGEMELSNDIVAQMEAVGLFSQVGVWFGEGEPTDSDGALLYGNYLLEEIRCKNNTGYKLIERNISITSDASSYNLGTIVDPSNPGSITGKKVNEDGEDLSGALIGLFEPGTETFTVENTYTGMTAISGEDGTFTFENVPKGNYVVHEIQPPAGYILSDESYPVSVNANQEGEEILLDDDIENYPTEVEFSKVDEDGNDLSGAVMQIVAIDTARTVDNWTTDGSVHTVTGKLEVGKSYVYTELVAPDGYVKGDAIYFTIAQDGQPVDRDGNPIELRMTNTATYVEINKYDDTETPIKGAELQILDSDGNVIDEWTSDGTTHIIEGKLAVGEKYTLHEVSAPAGYYVAEDIEFQVGSDGTATVGMIDDATWAGIVKVSSENGARVVGAVLQVKDQEGNIIDEWTTDENIHTLEGKLEEGKTYILHEVSAPAGYFPAEDIEFTAGDRVVMVDVKQTSLTVGKLSDIQEQPESGEIIWLPGATLQILDKDGKVLDEWTTDSQQHTIVPILTPGETYTLHEVSAPDGYCVSEDIQFTLDEEGQFVKSDAYESGDMWIRMTDLATKIEVQKNDEDGTPLAGAALQVIETDADGKETVVDSWVTDGSVHQIYGKLIAGKTYTLREVSAPAGYCIAADQQFTVGTDGQVQNITIKNLETKVGVEKVDENGDPLNGATLQIVDAVGTVVDEWISDGTTHQVNGVLVAGAEYTLREISVPDGYIAAEDQKFTVNADGSQTNVTLVNVSTKVQISKKAITGEAELPGASLEVRDSGGNVLDQWISGNEPHMITAKLKAGETYTLHEESAPDGYIVASDVEFTVNADGSITEVTMEDDTTKVEINKVTEGNEPLSGATLQILDKDGKVVDEWTSDGKAHTLEAELIAGATYTLHEVAAPDGYCVAADQTFVVDETGAKTVVTMTDLTTKVSVTKYDITGEKELSGAKLEIHSAKKETDGSWVRDGDAIETWTSNGTAHEVVGKLIAGQTYILHEESAPDGYVVATDVSFTVNPDGTVTKVIMNDDTTKVEINKVTEGNEPLSGAILQILDKDGNIVDEWTSDGAAHRLEAELTAGATYTLHEVSAPDGYCVAADQQFTVPKNGDTLTIQMTDLATKVEIQKLDADGTPLPGATLQVISKDTSGKETVVEEWISDGNVYEINATLIAGQTYILREVSAPAGYYKAKDVTFTVQANGTVTEVSLYNAMTKVSISKYDITGETEISGAHLEVRDKDGNVLDSWISNGQEHMIEGVLVAGQTYVLHESIPADGYVVASDVEFTVNEDGTATVVAMYDDTTKVEINKVTEDGVPLAGAVMQIIDKTGTVVDEWTSDGKAHTLEAELIAGATYTLHEVAAPDGYCVAADQQFTVNTDGSVTDISMTDLDTEVNIEKVDESGNPLKGATLQILDADGTVVEEWVSDGTTHTITAKLIAGATYTLHEVSAPAGYCTAADSTFTVNSDGTANGITLYNAKTKVSITKYDITGENELPGATLQIIDKDGNVIEEWVSTEEAHEIIGVLIAGQTYTLREVSAPDGYVVAEDTTFTVNADGTVTEVIMKDDTTKVHITKYDITGENELPGASLEVRDADGNVIDAWVSDGTAHQINGVLVAGQTYVLHEVSAPDGYVVASDIEFTVDADGNVTKVTMLDDTTKVHITKYDITGENELPGASLEVRDTDGNIIDAWVSDGTPHQIIGVLAVGKRYILHEVSAPDGYVVAEDIEFEVNADGSVTQIAMYDDTTKVHITKYTLTGENELPGASMQLLDSEGNVVDEWVSTEEAHEIIGVLTAGATYTLHEVAAPDGYVVANDVTFTVNTDGSVNLVSMYDDTTKVSITKQDITTGAALAGATLQIIDKDGNVMEEWVSTEEAHMIEAVLTAGETYTLREIAAPDGYVIAEDVPFTVNPDGTVTNVVMQDDVTKVSISKYDITGENELPGASLEVRDADGNIIDAWVSDGTPHQINGVLVAGATYTLHEVSAPDGYVVASDVEFTVNEDGTTNVVFMYDAPTVVHISKTDITTGEELPGAYLEIYDKNNQLIDSWVSTNEAHIIEAVLIAGETYTLIETSAPDGYVISEKIEFTVNLDNTITHVEMKDDTTKVQISKKAITGEDELPGATMQVLDHNGNVIDEWVSGNEPHLIEGVLIAGQTYILHEVAAPDGYVVANDIEFTVSETGEVDYVQMFDDTTKVEISKTDITGEQNIPGATLQIIDKDGNVIHEWISGTDVNYMEAELTAGETYTLREIAAPDGYVLAQDQQFTVNPDGTITQVTMQDDTTKVSITKYDITGENELPGATLQIIDKDGNVIEEWVSTNEAHLIEGVLIAGETYTLREISSPNGYVVAEDVTFTVNTDGSITHVAMYDDATEVTFQKVDPDGNPLKGAKLQLLDADGNIVEEWISDGTPHVLTAKLIVGETYTLHEVSAPDGYVLAKDQTFTVPENGTLTVTMTDEKAVITPPVASATTSTPISTASPKTADSTPYMTVGMGLLASLILMILARKKRKAA